MNPSNGVGIDTLIEMVKSVSKMTLHELDSSIEFEDPYLFLEVLRFLSDKLNDVAYQEHEPKLEKWLDKMHASSALKTDILAFYKEAVDVHQGRGRHVELALYLFNENIESYLSSRKQMLSDETYLEMEELFKLPKERLQEIISKDVSDYFISRQQSLEKEIDEWKDSSLSAELRKFHEDRNQKEVKMMTEKMDQATIGEGSVFQQTRHTPNQIGLE